MTERIRTTISLTPEAYEIFKRIANASNSSVSRAMGDWLIDTSDAAMMILAKMEEAKAAPVRVMREMQAMMAGMSGDLDALTEEVRTRRQAERSPGLRASGGPGGVRPAAPPSSNTGGKSPTLKTPTVVKASKK